MRQANTNQLTDQLVKNILDKGEDLKIRATLDALRNNTFTGGDDDDDDDDENGGDGGSGGGAGYRRNFKKKIAETTITASSRITSITTNCLNNKFEASNNSSTFNIKTINKVKK